MKIITRHSYLMLKYLVYLRHIIASVGGASRARESLTSDCEGRGVVYRLSRRLPKNLGLSVCHLPIERLNRPSRASSWR